MSQDPNLRISNELLKYRDEDKLYRYCIKNIFSVYTYIPI